VRNIFSYYNTVMNPEEETKPAQTHGSGWTTTLEWAKTITIALIIALPIRFFIAEPFIVSGASMDPTFASGQFLIVDRVTYRFEPPQRGDVIIFEYPNNPSFYYIKRVIGLPGETVTVTDGKVGIQGANGSTTTELDETYIDQAHAAHDTFTTTLEPNQYFVMGDNRAQSYDSRVWGPLDKHFIIGRPIVRLLPLNKISVLPGEVKE
jgi:signal peptidase I